MRFNVVILTGGGFGYAHFLFDPMRMLCDALEELGHSAIVSHNGLPQRARRRPRQHPVRRSHH